MGITTRISFTLAAFTACLVFGCAESVTRDGGVGMDAGPGSRDAGVMRDSGVSVCAPACDIGRDCCASECTNLENDPRNCGACARACEGDTYCTGGDCVATPCTASCVAGEVCCGDACCRGGEICCDPAGPVSRGPVCTAPDERGTCPVGCSPLCMCASPDTMIATPDGERRIADLRVGDLVYSTEDDAIVVVPLLRVRENPVRDHSVVRAVLEGGATLEISGLHPTAEGRAFGDLEVGDALDGQRIERIETIPYAHSATYDILPDSESGTYYASGVLIGSTLERETR